MFCVNMSAKMWWERHQEPGVTAGTPSSRQSASVVVKIAGVQPNAELRRRRTVRPFAIYYLFFPSPSVVLPAAAGH